MFRQACRVLRRRFIELGNLDVFMEAITIVSACNKVLRKRLVKPNTIGLIPTGGYSCNVIYSKKALMFLVHRESKDGCRISHGPNGQGFRLPKIPHLSVDVYCHEMNKVYEFNDCY